jgi:hypothetical protein
MRNGDISNELPKRVLVVSDIFLIVELNVKKKYKLIPFVQVEKKIRRDILSSLYLYTTNRGVTLELVSYGLTDEQLSETMDYLDNLGTNPFRYFSSYESINHLVNELPYRPEIVGVIDVPSNLLRYGHWGLDFNNI